MAKKKKKRRDKKKKPTRKKSKNPPVVAVVGMTCPDCGTRHEFDVHEDVPVISFDMQCRKIACQAEYNVQFRKMVFRKLVEETYILISLVRIDA